MAAPVSRPLNSLYPFYPLPSIPAEPSDSLVPFRPLSPSNSIPDTNIRLLYLGAYNASKAASLNLTKQIALDYARDRIVANALCPGLIKTAMTRDLNPEAAQAFLNATPWGDWISAEGVAGGAVFLASDEAAGMTGVALPVDGGYVAM